MAKRRPLHIFFLEKSKRKSLSLYLGLREAQHTALGGFSEQWNIIFVNLKLIWQYFIRIVNVPWSLLSRELVDDAVITIIVDTLNHEWIHKVFSDFFPRQHHYVDVAENALLLMEMAKTTILTREEISEFLEGIRKKRE